VKMGGVVLYNKCDRAETQAIASHAGREGKDVSREFGSKGQKKEVNSWKPCIRKTKSGGGRPCKGGKKPVITGMVKKRKS